MTTRTLYVRTLAEATDLIRSFGERKSEVLEDAMIGALVNTPFLMEVWQKTPKSERARYAEQMGIKVNWKKRAQMEKGWKDKILNDETRSPYAVLERYKRLEAYGNSNLAKSIMPWGQKAASDDLRRHIATDGKKISFILSSDLPYAKRMHESPVPATNVWQPGQKRGWSVKGTSGHFIYGTPDSPVERYHRKLVAETSRNILFHTMFEGR